MFNGITTYVILTLVIMIMGITGIGYWYFSHSQREIAVLRQNAARLEQAVQTQQQTIQAHEQAQARTNQQVLDLQTRLSGAERTRRDMELRLRRQNLEAEARVRRAQTEAQINQNFQDQMRSFEQLSGHVPVTTSTTTSSDPQPPPRPPVRRSP